MKEWAKEFYHSKDWKDTRRTYLKLQHYLCERCGEPAKVVHHKHYLTKQNINNADIALNWDNLEALCQDCHNKEHHAAADTRRYKFDADGNVIPTQP